jgi:hypothetical protein
MLAGMTRLVSASVLAAATTLVLAGTGCGASGPAAPASPVPSASAHSPGPATIAIIAPANSEVIRRPEVRVRVRLTATSPARSATGQPFPGYLHLYLDGHIVSIQPVPPSYGVTDQVIRRLRPGPHQLRAEFVQPDHLPFRPQVVASVTFTVRPRAGPRRG